MKFWRCGKCKMKIRVGSKLKTARERCSDCGLRFRSYQWGGMASTTVQKADLLAHKPNAVILGG